MLWLLTRARHPQSRRGRRRHLAELPRRAERAPLLRVLRAAALPAALRPPESHAPSGTPAASSPRGLWGPGLLPRLEKSHDLPKRAGKGRISAVTKSVRVRPNLSPLLGFPAESRPPSPTGLLSRRPFSLSSLHRHVPRHVMTRARARARTHAHIRTHAHAHAHTPRPSLRGVHSRTVQIKTVFIKI